MNSPCFNNIYYIPQIEKDKIVNSEREREKNGFLCKP